MKLLLYSVILILLTPPIFAQKTLIGKYWNYFGESISINPDHTFEYTWAFDLFSGWVRGKWEKKEDTIYFKMVPIYDTLTYSTDNKIIDSLVLSLNPIPSRILMVEYPLRSLASGGQTPDKYPHKLYFHHNRLYEFDTLGNLKTNLEFSWWYSPPKYHTWFEKMK